MARYSITFIGQGKSETLNTCTFVVHVDASSAKEAGKIAQERKSEFIKKITDNPFAMSTMPISSGVVMLDESTVDIQRVRITEAPF